jgi:hypothetical protein
LADVRNKYNLFGRPEEKRHFRRPECIGLNSFKIYPEGQDVRL